jgi:hypothetical protein
MSSKSMIGKYESKAQGTARKSRPRKPERPIGVFADEY